MIDFDDAVGNAGGVFGEDGFHGLHGGDDLAVGGDVVVGKLAGGFKSLRPLGRGAAEFYGRDFANESLQHFHAVAALRPLAPGLQKLAVVVIVDVDLARKRRALLDGAFHASLAAVSVPDTVVEAE